MESVEPQRQFKDFIEKHEFAIIIKDIISEIDTTICILDTNNSPLLGTLSNSRGTTPISAVKTPIEFEGNVVAIVCGEKKTSIVANLIVSFGSFYQTIFCWLNPSPQQNQV